MEPTLTVTRFAGKAASVNAWIVANDSHALIIDALRSEDEAAELAATVTKSGKTLFAIVITHGHPDHYIGLRVLKETFPAARVLVARPEIKADIIGFSQWMESVGWLDGIPRMKVRSSANPDGFDYEGTIDVIDGTTLSLPNGGELTIDASYPAMEAAHMTTLYAPEINALFTADLVYNDVHPWLGQGVERSHAETWIATLATLKDRYGDSKVTIHPGHGPSGGIDLIDGISGYITAFLAQADRATTNDALSAAMTSLYPRHEQADFLLHYSVLNHGPGERKAA
jgi:glyoxylase-like metal-dependent hydrolase (beta-lactamase superfamily II)